MPFKLSPSDSEVYSRAALRGGHTHGILAFRQNYISYERNGGDRGTYPV